LRPTWNKPQVGFERDIRPLFREKDAQSMPATFDRSSDNDAKASADKILEKVTDGLMPCDRPRAEDQMARFREWVAARYPA
jgi:hypothetical protein